MRLLSGFLCFTVTAMVCIAEPPASSPFTPIATYEIQLTPGHAVPPAFLGLSHEWGVGQDLAGSSATGINRIYRQLLQNLTSYGSGPIIIRIGGNSTDTTGPASKSALAPFAELASSLGVHFYFGVNMASDNPQLAVGQAAAYLSAMPEHSVDGIEIGNEPDGYRWNGKRSRSFQFPDFERDSRTFQNALLASLPEPVRLVGPSYGVPIDINDFVSYLKTIKPSRLIASQHYYVTNAQTHPHLPDDFLLQPSSSTAGPDALAPAVEAAHQYGVPYRIDETNSIAAGGEAGISDAFSSALWATDTLFEFAAKGVDGLNWHTGNGGPYALFEFRVAKLGEHTTYELKSVRPIYYGILLFQQATGDGAQLLPIPGKTSANVKAWATIGKNGTVRAVVINKEKTGSAAVSLKLAGFQSANVERLTAPDYRSKSGVRIGGQTFDGSVDGRLTGQASNETIHPAGSDFQFTLPSASAVLITFAR